MKCAIPSKQIRIQSQGQKGCWPQQTVGLLVMSPCILSKALHRGFSSTYGVCNLHGSGHSPCALSLCSSSHAAVSVIFLGFSSMAIWIPDMEIQAISSSGCCWVTHVMVSAYCSSRTTSRALFKPPFDLFWSPLSLYGNPTAPIHPPPPEMSIDSLTSCLSATSTLQVSLLKVPYISMQMKILKSTRPMFSFKNILWIPRWSCS